MEYTYLEKWTRPDCYMGETYEEYYVVYSINRDSCLVEESNWACILNLLGGESETVIVASASHCACGWLDILLIHESNKELLTEANNICEGLEDYPVVNEDHWLELGYIAEAKLVEEIREDFKKDPDCSCWGDLTKDSTIEEIEEYAIEVVQEY